MSRSRSRSKSKGSSKSRSKSRSGSPELADLVKSRKSSDAKAKAADAQGNGCSKGDGESKGGAQDKKSAAQKLKVKPAVVFPGEDAAAKPRAVVKSVRADNGEGDGDQKRKGDTDANASNAKGDAEEEKRRKRAEKFGTGGSSDNKDAPGAQGNGSATNKDTTEVTSAHFMILYGLA